MKSHFETNKTHNNINGHRGILWFINNAGQAEITTLYTIVLKEQILLILFSFYYCGQARMTSRGTNS